MILAYYVRFSYTARKEIGSIYKCDRIMMLTEYVLCIASIIPTIGYTFHVCNRFTIPAFYRLGKSITIVLRVDSSVKASDA